MKTWETDDLGFDRVQVGHLNLVSWHNPPTGKAYWVVKVSGFVLQTGVSKDVAEGRQDAMDAANRLAIVLLAALKKLYGTADE